MAVDPRAGIRYRLKVVGGGEDAAAAEDPRRKFTGKEATVLQRTRLGTGVDPTSREEDGGLTGNLLATDGERRAAVGGEGGSA